MLEKMIKSRREYLEDKQQHCYSDPAKFDRYSQHIDRVLLVGIGQHHRKIRTAYSKEELGRILAVLPK